MAADLEYYRRQAKALLQAVHDGDGDALQRLERHSPKLKRTAFGLHDAQLALAREHGFPSWPRFRNFILQSGPDFDGLVGRFVEAALEDSHRAAELLAAQPELAGAGLHAALVLGDFRRVEETLREVPGMAATPGGPRSWQPLLYVCFSRFANGTSNRAADLARTAEVLLERGADPNAAYISEAWPDNPLSCLYGAVGVNNNAALALTLLKAGARTDDSESLYHSTEHPDLACLRLLLEHGASPAGTNALQHMLDREDAGGLELLLAAGADPNETNGRGETALHWAVWRGRSPRIAGILLDRGAGVDARRQDGRTAYALAVQSGQTETAAMLAARGASTEVSALDRFLGACSAGGPAELERLPAEAPELAGTPESERLLPDLAISHRTAAVRGLLAAGLPVDARGENGATALHWACWKGYADLVKLLLEHGASLTIEDEQFHAPPTGWFDHGRHNCPERGGDYAEVARLLAAAGAVL